MGRLDQVPRSSADRRGKRQISPIRRAIIVFAISGVVGPLCQLVFLERHDSLREFIFLIWPTWVFAVGEESAFRAYVITICSNIVLFSIIGALFGLAVNHLLRACLTIGLLAGHWYWVEFMFMDRTLFFSSSAVFLLIILILTYWDHRSRLNQNSLGA